MKDWLQEFDSQNSKRTELKDKLSLDSAIAKAVKIHHLKPKPLATLADVFPRDLAQ